MLLNKSYIYYIVLKNNAKKYLKLILLYIGIRESWVFNKILFKIFDQKHYKTVVYLLIKPKDW